MENIKRTGLNNRHKIVRLIHNGQNVQALKYCLQKEALPLPKSTTPSRILSNLDIFSFDIKSDDMKKLDEFDGIERVGSHPDTVDY